MLDVLICTKNSDRIFKRIYILDECFKSIKQEVPYSNVILVDSFSTDKTIQKANKYFGKKLKIIFTKEKLGKAREIGFKASKADWIFVIDSDVVLPKNTWNKIKVFTEKYDAIECSPVNYYPSGKIVTYRRRVRGILCATLIKRKFLEGIKIPEDMEVYEDELIKRFLISKGGKWFPSDIKVRHYPKDITLQTACKVGYFSGKYKLKPFIVVLGGLIKYHNKFYFMQFKWWIKGRFESLLLRKN